MVDVAPPALVRDDVGMFCFHFFDVLLLEELGLLLFRPPHFIPFDLQSEFRLVVDRGLFLVRLPPIIFVVRLLLRRLDGRDLGPIMTGRELLGGLSIAISAPAIRTDPHTLQGVWIQGVELT